MELTHLEAFLPSFLDEIEKEADIKEDLKAGTKKVYTALKDAPRKSNDALVRAAVRLQNSGKLGEKIVTEGPELFAKLVT